MVDPSRFLQTSQAKEVDFHRLELASMIASAARKAKGAQCSTHNWVKRASIYRESAWGA